MAPIADTPHGHPVAKRRGGLFLYERPADAPQGHPEAKRRGGLLLDAQLLDLLVPFSDTTLLLSVVILLVFSIFATATL